ncbi:hypothetical protein ABWL39_19375 [Chitinivorax sp. PXF-14]|uniref:hypothetical protein n=1 Tax=Chitinivorax sp. PXF-14 TaxID=3230488 RepID=UPI00346796DA
MPYEAVMLHKLLISIALLPLNLYLASQLFDLVEARLLRFGHRYELAGFALLNLLVFALIWQALPAGAEADPQQSLVALEKAAQPERQQAGSRWRGSASMTAGIPQIEIR